MYTAVGGACVTLCVRREASLLSALFSTDQKINAPPVFVVKRILYEVVFTTDVTKCKTNSHICSHERNTSTDL